MTGKKYLKNEIKDKREQEEASAIKKEMSKNVKEKA